MNLKETCQFLSHKSNNVPEFELKALQGVPFESRSFVILHFKVLHSSTSFSYHNIFRHTTIKKSSAEYFCEKENSFRRSKTFSCTLFHTYFRSRFCCVVPL